MSSSPRLKILPKLPTFWSGWNSIRMATSAMAYMVIDPNGDGDESDDALYFVSWNRVAYTWNKPVVVAVAGSQPTEGPVGAT